MAPKISDDTCVRTRVSVRALLLAACVSLSTATDAAEECAYGAMIDAGSSSSRLYLYRWPVRNFTSVPPPTTVPALVPGVNLRASGSISTQNGRNGLSTLLTGAADKLRELEVTDLSTVPVFLAGTSSMRMLTNAQRADVMDQVRTLLAASPFMFKSEWARTIAGNEEAVASFLAAHAVRSPSLLTDGLSSGRMYGTLELGASGLNIAFAPEQGDDIVNSKSTIELSEKFSTDAYATSFLYYGQTEATRRINEMVIMSQIAGTMTQPGAVVNNPCYMNGDSVQFDSAVVGGTITFAGRGNAADCAVYARALLHKGAQCLTDAKSVEFIAAIIPGFMPTQTAPVLQAIQNPALRQSALDYLEFVRLRTVSSMANPPTFSADAAPSTCSINGVYQPPVQNGDREVTFLAFSGFAFIYEALGVAYNARISDLRTAATRYCSQNVADAATNFPAASADFRSTYCLTGTWASILLQDAFGIHPDEEDRVVVIPSSESVSIATGLMYSLVNSLPWYAELPPVLVDKDVEVVSPVARDAAIALGVILAVVLIGAAWWFLKQRKAAPPTTATYLPVASPAKSTSTYTAATPAPISAPAPAPAPAPAVASAPAPAPAAVEPVAAADVEKAPAEAPVEAPAAAPADAPAPAPATESAAAPAAPAENAEPSNV